MTAASVSTVPTETAAPDPSAKLLDAILGGSLSKIAAPVPATSTVEDVHPLVTIDTVEAAMPIIGKMMVAEREAGGTRVYPRRLLRQQHIVALYAGKPLCDDNGDLCLLRHRPRHALGEHCEERYL
jgi:hypothetical protein